MICEVCGYNIGDFGPGWWGDEGGDRMAWRLKAGEPPRKPHTSRQAWLCPGNSPTPFSSWAEPIHLRTPFYLCVNLHRSSFSVLSLIQVNNLPEKQLSSWKRYFLHQTQQYSRAVKVTLLLTLCNRKS